MFNKDLFSCFLPSILQASDGRCPCRAAYRLYDGRTDGDCQPRVYPLCGEALCRGQDGSCRSLEEWNVYCANEGCRSPDLAVEFDKTLGVCICRVCLFVMIATGTNSTIYCYCIVVLSTV